MQSALQTSLTFPQLQFSARKKGNSVSETIHVGDLVFSNLSSKRTIYKVTALQDRQDAAPLATMKLLYDDFQNPTPNRKPTQADVGWLVKVTREQVETFIQRWQDILARLPK